MISRHRIMALFLAGMLASLLTATSTEFKPLRNYAIAVNPDCTPTSDTATVAGYTVLTFSTIGTCNWNAPSGISSIDSLVVVGGGGGGAGAYTPSNTDGAGAGGGGGAFSANSVSIPTSVSIQVGGGGAGGTASANRNGNNGLQGSSSAFGTITAGGGGGGGCETVGSGSSCLTTAINGGNGTAAGSGGGASNYYNAYNSGGAGTASNATFNGNVFTSQSGYSGGVYVAGSSISGASGPGGGARASATYNTIGTALISNITGTSVEYGKGGGAYGVSGWSFRSSTSGYGTGGDGQRGANASGANGAQGVVILRYKNIPSTSYSLGNSNIFFRTSNTISATPNLSGKLTFRANNIIIPGCKNLVAIAYTPRTCNYKPSIRGKVNLTVVLTPTDLTFSSSTTQIGTYFIGTRSGSR